MPAASGKCFCAGFTSKCLCLGLRALDRQSGFGEGAAWGLQDGTVSPESQEGASLFLSRSVRSYISAEGVSIRNAKEFLVRQTRSMRKRHTALKAAKQQWRQDMRKAQEAVQDPDSSQLLEGVRKNLEEVSP